MKCDNCKHLKVYTTGRDEYPPCTTIPYCEKGHWDGDPIDFNATDENDLWVNCLDYEQTESILIPPLLTN